VWGEKVVMRILDNSGSSMNLDDLGLLEHNFETYKTSYTKPYGMILVTGPTGSGKSTTLYTTLNTVARPEINVITVEDPVEYRMAGINQVQVNPKAGLTFASALRSILRSDPDVVLLGEIRDHETAQIAIEASLTGHLVLSTLHTNDAPSAITRLTEMGIEPFLVGSALDAVVAQRLARRLCDRCKGTYLPDVAELEAMSFPLTATGEAPVLYQPVGCSVCSNTGYRGRIAIHEIMAVSEEIERLAVRRASSAEIKAVAMAEGMLTLRQDGWSKVTMGLTSVEEILRVVA
jgi:type IV pilus assembly protein PilB